jgi:hypothetical protein
MDENKIGDILEGDHRGSKKRSRNWERRCKRGARRRALGAGQKNELPTSNFERRTLNVKTIRGRNKVLLRALRILVWLK